MEVTKECQLISSCTSNNVPNNSLAPPVYTDNYEEELPTYEDYMKNVCQENVSFPTSKTPTSTIAPCQASSSSSHFVLGEVHPPPNCSHQKLDKDYSVIYGTTVVNSDSQRQDHNQLGCSDKINGNSDTCGKEHATDKPAPLPARLKRARFEVSRVTDDSLSFGSTSSSSVNKADSTTAGTPVLQGQDEDEVFTVNVVPTSGDRPVIVVGGDTVPQQEGQSIENSPKYCHIFQTYNSNILLEDTSVNNAGESHVLFSRNEQQARQNRRSPTPKALKELAWQQMRRPSIDMSRVVTECKVHDFEENETGEVINYNKLKQESLGDKPDSTTGSCPKGNISLFQQNIANFGNHGDDVVITVKELPWLKKPEKCEVMEEAEPKPNDYMTLACLVLVCCNFVFGSIAFGFSVATNTTYEKGNYTRSWYYSKAAKVIALLGIVITVVMVVALLVVFWPEKEESPHNIGTYGV